MIVNSSCYRRDKHLQDFIDKLDPKALREYGEKQLPKDYMTDYNYGSYDDNDDAQRSEQLAMNILVPLARSNKRRAAE